MDQKGSGVSPEITLRSIIRLYQDPETNPKRKEASVTARYYSHRYASHIATQAMELEKVLEKTMKKLSDKPICEVIRMELKDTAFNIV